MSAANLQDAIAALARLGCKPTKSGDGYVAFCPIHEADGSGHKPSLSIKSGDTVPVIVNCHAGCDSRDILKALGLNGTNGTAHKSATIAAVYRYQTEDGGDVREKLRYAPKDFRIRHRDAAGNWIYKAGDGPAVLYRLPEVSAAIAEGRTVFVVEGEKDADRLASLGLMATTNIEGAAKPDQRAKWRPEYTAQLSGAARVILLPDNDDPGRAHMRHIAEQLAGKVGEVRWLELPGLPEKGDASDWLNAGHTADELKALAGTAAPPKAETEEPTTRLRFCDTAKMRDAELTPPRFLIHPLIPRDQVTLFGGHGGGGKTLVGYVLCAHVATGTDFAGMRVMPGKALVVSFEDPEALILWRFRNIADEYGLDMEKMIRNIKIIDATEAQPIMREISESGVRDVQPTGDGSDLMEIIRNEKFDLVQIDNVSDAFDGDENSRRQVRKFVRYLASAIRVQQSALLLLAHIDKAAARYGAQGNSYSGSTAWHNSARSRLALIDGQLRQEKLNIGKKLDGAIRFRFTARGVPVLDDGAGDRDERNQQDRVDDEALIECFAAASEAAATVSTAESGPATTWHALSVYREFPQELLKNKVRFRQGIARLVRDGKIVREPYQDAHRNRRERYALVCVSSASVQEPTQPTPYPSACVSSRRGYRGGTNERTQNLEPTRHVNSDNPDPELTHRVEGDNPELTQHAKSPDLPDLLAAEAGIHIDRLLAGRLTEAEWPRLCAAHTSLAARLPAGERAGLRALVARIDAAGQAVVQ